MGLNLLAPLVCAQAANAVMQGQGTGGAIVNISSISAGRPAPTIAAVRRRQGRPGLADRLAGDGWAPRVRVSTIDVGLCRTEQTDDHYGDDASVGAIELDHPARRMAEPERSGTSRRSWRATWRRTSRGHGRLPRRGETPAFLAVQDIVQEGPS